MPTARVQKWWPKIQQYAAQHGVPADLLAAIIDFESGGDPNAGHKGSGATGLGQVMPREAGFPGRPTKQELLDPDTNLDWSARILGDAWKRWKTPQQASAAYLGALDRKGNVTNAADANGTTGHMYVARIMKTLEGTGETGTQVAPAGAGAGAGRQPMGQQGPQGGMITDMQALMALGLPDPSVVYRTRPQGGPSPGTTGGAAPGAAAPGAGGRRWPVPGNPRTNAGFGAPQSITGGYGANFGNKPHNQRGQPLNTGMDITAQAGAPIGAVTGGTVIEARAYSPQEEAAGRDSTGGYGNTVVVQGDDGLRYRYSHMQAPARFQKGQRVGGGALLGTVGDTGNATGPHLDLEITDQQGNYIDGAGLIRGDPQVTRLPPRGQDDPGFYRNTPGGDGASVDPGFYRGAGPGAPNLNASGFQLMSSEGTTTTPPPDGPDPTQVWRDAGRSVRQGILGGRAPVDAASGAPPADGPDPAQVWRDAGKQVKQGVLGPQNGTPAQAAGSKAMGVWEDYLRWRDDINRKNPKPAAGPIIPPGTPGTTRPAAPDTATVTPGAATPTPEAAPSAGDTGAAGADYSQLEPTEGDSRVLAAAKAKAKRALQALEAENAKRTAAPALIAAAQAKGYTIPARIGREERASLPPEVVAAYDAQEAAKAYANPDDPAAKRLDALGKAMEAALTDLGEARTKEPANKAAEGGRPAPGSAEERARGVEGQGAGPTGQGGPVNTVDVGNYIYLYDDKGQWLGAWKKQQGNEPKLIGSTTGPKVLRYDPATDTATWVDNPAYTNKRTPVTTGDDVQYLVYEDEQGKKTVETNPNYNPWSAGQTSEGKGAAEGKVTHIGRDGTVSTVDTLTPDERALTTRGVTADIGSKEALTKKTEAEAAALQRKEQNWAKIQEAWQRGASMEEINGLVLQSAQDVNDFVALQAEDRARQTQAETQRKNLSEEELTRQQRRREDVAQYGTAMESYGRFGVASAPWQTSVLAAAAPLQGVGAAAKGMGIPQDQPWVQGIQKQHDDYAARQANTAGAARQAFETTGRSMFGPKGAQVNSGAGGNYGTTQKPPPQATGAWEPPGPAGPSQTGTYVNKPQGEAITAEAPAAPQEQPSAGGPRTPKSGQEALDLGDPEIAAMLGVEVQPGKAATVYEDGGPPEIWDINQGGGWLPAPTGVYGTGGGGGAGGGEGPVYSQGRKLARKRRPVPGKSSVDMGDGRHVVTHYDDGSREVWDLYGSGPSWEGVGGGGSGYWGQRPTTYGIGHTGGGGSSVWQLPPGATVSMAQGLPPGQTPTAQQVQPQQAPLAPQSGVAPLSTPPVTGTGDTTTARFPTPMSGGYGGPAAAGGQGGGGRARTKGQEYQERERQRRGKGGGAAPPGFPDPTAQGAGATAMPPPPPPGMPVPGMPPPGGPPAPPPGPVDPLTYGAGAPYMGGGGNSGFSSVYAQNGTIPSAPRTPAPMWDAALGAGGRNMTMGPGGRQGNATLYTQQGGGGGGRGGATNYGGPTAPAAITPLQRLLEQSGLVPRMAGQAAGSPGGI